MKASHDSSGPKCLVRGSVAGSPERLDNSNITPSTGTNITREYVQNSGSAPSEFFAEFDQGGLLDRRRPGGRSRGNSQG